MLPKGLSGRSRSCPGDTLVYMKKRPRPKRRPGRPETRTLKVDATPDEIVEKIFAKAKPPDPSLRRRLRTKKET